MKKRHSPFVLQPSSPSLHSGPVYPGAQLKLNSSSPCHWMILSVCGWFVARPVYFALARSRISPPMQAAQPLQAAVKSTSGEPLPLSQSPGHLLLCVDTPSSHFLSPTVPPCARSTISAPRSAFLATVGATQRAARQETDIIFILNVEVAEGVASEGV